jgi:hypothetical protein
MLTGTALVHFPSHGLNATYLPASAARFKTVQRSKEISLSMLAALVKSATRKPVLSTTLLLLAAPGHKEKLDPFLKLLAIGIRLKKRLMKQNN